MKKNEEIDQKSLVKVLFIVFSIGLISFLTYMNILDPFLGGWNDNIELIEKGRIQSFDDVIRIFSEPSLSHLHFYRPITTLSYSFDYSIWKLNYFGYNLTNLILHMFIAILIFFVARLLLNGKQGAAWLSALIFTTHPILSESVHNLSSRVDLIAAFFVLISLWLYLKYFVAFRKKGYIYLSVIFYMIAIGAKEIAVILPFIIGSHIMIFFENDSLKAKLAHLIKVLLPYLITTIVFISWRTYILKGIGGYSKLASASQFNVLQDIQRLIKNIALYFVDLLYPVDFLNLFSLFGRYPYIIKLTGFLVIVAIFSSFLLFSGIYRNNMKDFFIKFANTKVIVLLLMWLILPLSIYLLFLKGRFYHRLMYIAVIPFSIIVSVIFIESYQSTISKIRNHYSSGGSFSSFFLNSKIISFVLIGVLLISFLVYSPLVRTYDKLLDYSNMLASVSLTRISDIAAELSDDSIINIYGFPGSIIYNKNPLPDKVKLCVNDSTIKSWLNINYPDNNFHVVVHTLSDVAIYPDSIISDKTLETRIEHSKDGIINIIFNFDNSA